MGDCLYKDKCVDDNVICDGFDAEFDIISSSYALVAKDIPEVCNETNTIRFEDFALNLLMNLAGTKITSSCLESVFSPLQRTVIKFKPLECPPQRIYDIDSLIIVSKKFPIKSGPCLFFPYPNRDLNLKSKIHINLETLGNARNLFPKPFADISNYKQCLYIKCGDICMYSCLLVFPRMRGKRSNIPQNFMTEEELKTLFEEVLLRAFREVLSSNELINLPTSYKKIEAQCMSNGKKYSGYFLVSNRNTHAVLERCRVIIDNSEDLEMFRDFCFVVFAKNIKNEIKGATPRLVLQKLTSILKNDVIDLDPGSLYIDVAAEFQPTNDDMSLYWNRSTTTQLLSVAGCNPNGPETYFTCTTFAGDLCGARAEPSRKTLHPNLKFVNIYHTDKNVFWLSPDKFGLEPTANDVVNVTRRYDAYVKKMLAVYSDQVAHNQYSARIEYRVNGISEAASVLHSLTSEFSSRHFFEVPTKMMNAYRYALTLLVNEAIILANRFDVSFDRRKDFLYLMRGFLLGINREMELVLGHGNYRRLFMRDDLFKLRAVMNEFNFPFVKTSVVDWSSFTVNITEASMDGENLLNIPRSQLFKPKRLKDGRLDSFKKWTQSFLSFKQHSINSICESIIESFCYLVYSKFPVQAMANPTIKLDGSLDAFVLAARYEYESSFESTDIFDHFFPRLCTEENLFLLKFEYFNMIQYAISVFVGNSLLQNIETMFDILNSKFCQLTHVPVPLKDRIWASRAKTLKVVDLQKSHQSQSVIQQPDPTDSSRSKRLKLEIEIPCSVLKCPAENLMIAFVRNLWSILFERIVVTNIALKANIDDKLQHGSIFTVLETLNSQSLDELEVGYIKTGGKKIWLDRFDFFFPTDGFTEDFIQRRKGQWKQLTYIDDYQSMIGNGDIDFTDFRGRLMTLFCLIKILPDSNYTGSVWPKKKYFCISFKDKEN